MKSGARSLKVSLALYVVIVMLFFTLIGWWVYFFSSKGDELAEHVELSGPLNAGQYSAIHEQLGEWASMFFFEGIFLGVLLLASVLLVLRAVRRELVLNRQQRNFLSAVTHELRSPLASAKLYLESIRQGRADGEKAERYLAHAQEDIERLEDLVEDLLTARRMTGETAEVHPETMDLSGLVLRRVERFAALHDHATVELDAPAAVMVEADPQALDRVLENLLGNALKYGGAQPRIEVGVGVDGRSGLLTVRDFGPGLQGADPQRILEPFVRGKDENVRTQPGAGLGLFIVKELVGAHRGSLRIDDTLDGGGTRVAVRVPLTPGLPRNVRPTHTWGLSDDGPPRPSAGAVGGASRETPGQAAPPGGQEQQL